MTQCRDNGYNASTTASKHLIGNDSLIISLAHSIRLQTNWTSSIAEFLHAVTTHWVLL